jgi:dihydroorotate dehydrogenase (fumarate)
MTDLSTKYLGLELKNPIIIGSSGLTDSAAKIRELEKNGAAAVVLKSIFEEEITLEYEKLLAESSKDTTDSEKMDYLDEHIKQDNISKYIKLIEDSKKAVSIPVIASINCNTPHEWPYFAEKIEKAGADALELNIFILPSDYTRTSLENEDAYFEIVSSALQKVNIPVSVKISSYFSSLALHIQKLSETGISGMVLFNRFHQPDIDIETKKLVSTNIFSQPEDYSMPLRWTGIMSRTIKCDLAASTGIHSGESMIKLLLAGADAVQIVSALYLKGSGHIQQMLLILEKWMSDNKYSTINEFRGLMAQKQLADPSAFERAQFMKYFGGYHRNDFFA